MKAAVAIRRAIWRWCARSSATVPVVLGSATPALGDAAQRAARAATRNCGLPRRDDQAAAPRLKLIDVRAHSRSPRAVDPGHRAIAAPLCGRRPGTGVHQSARLRADAAVHRLRLDGPLRALRCAPDRASGRASCSAITAARAEPLPQRCRRCGLQVKPVGQGTERVERNTAAAVPGARRCCGSIATPRRSRRSSMPSSAHSARRGAHPGRHADGDQGASFSGHLAGGGAECRPGPVQHRFSRRRAARPDHRAGGRPCRTRATAGRGTDPDRISGTSVAAGLLHGGYDGFAASALAEREAARWPPFGRLALLRASTRSSGGALQISRRRARSCARRARGAATRPGGRAMARRAGRHYAQLLIESAERGPLHRFIDEWLPQVESLARA